MEDNSKLFVFDKKEVILIFVFVVLIAITAFTMGVRFGKQLSLKKDQYSKVDQDIIDLKSTEEERVDLLTGDETENEVSRKSDFEESLKDKQLNNLDTEDRLKQEMERLLNDDDKDAAVPAPKKPETAPSKTANNSTEDIYRPKGKLSGKYTIQLAAFDSKEEAQNFADGFIVSGYDAIINEVIIPGKGTWYRVSIGLFDDINKARQYLEKEKNFFQGKDYLINKLE